MTYQFVYSSVAVTPMQTDDLEELLAHARRGNAARGITGALVYAEGIFLQIIEGDKDQVLDLMAEIRRDIRHESVAVLREGDVPSPTFGSWKMAYVSATPQQMAQWAGLSPANGSTESPGEAAEENNRTARFAQDILSLLTSDDKAEGKGG